jgi:uncharacterized protein (DUF488 family)
LILPSSDLTIWTIGHSNHPLARFVELLRAHGIQVVADVRSRPYSRFAPRYNRQALAEALPEHDIRYLFLGKELGGKPKEPGYYLPDSSLDPERFTARPEFQRGLKRLLGEAAHFRVSLMCSEGDPGKCHRSLLLAPELVKRGVKVLHILPDGGLLEHRQVELPRAHQPRQLRLF